MKQLSIAFLVIAVSLSECNRTQLFAQTNENSVPLTAASSDQWRIRWDRSDDFNGDEVDWRKWNQSPENFGAWVWDNENNVAVSRGVLQITMRRLPTPVVEGRRPPTPYSSGMLKSLRRGSPGSSTAKRSAKNKIDTGTAK